MRPCLDPCEPPYNAGATEDLVALMRPGVPPIALFRVLAHNPRVLSRFRGGRLLDAGTLSARERELVILRVCHLCDCEYEWTVFADFAGLDDADLEATQQRSAAGPLSRRERLMLETADELVAGQKLTDHTAANLRSQLEPAEIAELIALVGRYISVALVANAAGLPLEPGCRGWTALRN
jgi:4-carboxymuconolactone decarboxylase